MLNNEWVWYKVFLTVSDQLSHTHINISDFLKNQFEADEGLFVILIYPSSIVPLKNKIVYGSRLAMAKPLISGVGVVKKADCFVLIPLESLFQLTWHIAKGKKKKEIANQQNPTTVIKTTTIEWPNAVTGILASFPDPVWPWR